MKKVVLVALCTLALSSTTRADEFIYANNAGGTGTDSVWQIDLTTGGTITNEYAIPGIGNGRGVIDVNNVLYVTTADGGNVYSFNINTSALSTVFTVSGASGLASITYDGTDFWIGDYSGTDKAFLYTPGGTLLKTVDLTNCTGFCDGLTFVAANGGELLSNRFDGAAGLSKYDLYDTNGKLVTSDFIDTTTLSGCTNTTGIAWDGTNYFVSCIFGNVAEYNASGDFVQLITLSNPSNFTNGGQGPLIEGLSANFAITIPPPQVPEPTSIVLLGSALLIGCVARRRRLNRPKGCRASQ